MFNAVSHVIGWCSRNRWPAPLRTTNTRLMVKYGSISRRDFFLRCSQYRARNPSPFDASQVNSIPDKNTNSGM